MTEAVECLVCKHKARISNTSSTKKMFKNPLSSSLPFDDLLRGEQLFSHYVSIGEGSSQASYQFSNLIPSKFSVIIPSNWLNPI